MGLKIKKMNKLFWIRIGILQRRVLVCIGYKDVELLKRTVKGHIPRNVFREIKDTDHEGCLYNDDKGRPVMLHLVVPSEDTIAHEVNHIVEFFADYFGFQQEKEFKAFLTEYLRRQVKQQKLILRP